MAEREKGGLVNPKYELAASDCAAALPIKPARRRSLSEEIVDQLLTLIASGDAPEVALPPERVLCERFEVSRSVVREALAALSHLGVLETRGKVKYGSLAGARARLAARTEPDQQRRELIDHPLEVRRMLEVDMAAMAARRVGPEELAAIELCLERMEQAVQRGEGTVEHDSAFHTAIARATGNQTLVQLVHAIADAISASRELSLQSTSAVQSALAAHREIVAALRARDPDRARAATARHLDAVEDSVHELLSE